MRKRTDGDVLPLASAGATPVETFQSWARRREARANGLYLIGAACVVLALAPLSLAQLSANLQQTEFVVAVAIFGVVMTFLAALVLFALASGTRKPWYISRPGIEFFALAVFITMLGLRGTMSALNDTSMTTGIIESAPAELVSIAASAATFSALGIAIASLLLVGAQRYFWVLVAFSLATLIDHSALWQLETLWSSALVILSHVFAAIVHAMRERSFREAFRTEQALRQVDADREAFLLTMLPENAYARLQMGERVADSYADLTVAFIDLAGFTSLARRVSPGLLVDLLNRFFRAADDAAARAGVEKVKTIGDCYMAVAGGGMSRSAGTPAMAEFALEVVAAAKAIGEAAGVVLDARVGIHVGPAIGGIIGQSRPVYDYWGETINLASRLEGHAPPGGMALSEAAWLMVRSRFPDALPVRAEIKGVGAIDLFTLMPPDNRIAP